MDIAVEVKMYIKTDIPGKDKVQPIILILVSIHDLLNS